LAAGLRPDPLGELKCSPRSPSHNKGALLLKGGEGRGGEGGKGRGRERSGKGGGREGSVPLFHIAEVATLHCWPFASNLEQVVNPRCAQVNSASYP